MTRGPRVDRLLCCLARKDAITVSSLYNNNTCQSVNCPCLLCEPMCAVRKYAVAGFTRLRGSTFYSSLSHTSSRVKALPACSMNKCVKHWGKMLTVTFLYLCLGLNKITLMKCMSWTGKLAFFHEISNLL